MKISNFEFGFSNRAASAIAGVVLLALAVAAQGQGIFPGGGGGSGDGDASKSETLAQFAPTTSLLLKGVITDESGDGPMLFGNDTRLTGKTRIDNYSLVVTNHGAMGATETISFAKRFHTATIDADCVVTIQDFDIAAGLLAASTTIRFTQDATGGHVLSWAGAVTMVAPQINPAPDSVTHVTIETTDGIYGYAFSDYIGNAAAATLTLSAETEAYDASGWNNDLTVPTKDAIRDKFEAGDAVFIIPVGDETTTITTGTAKVTWRAPFAFTLTGVKAEVNTVSSSGKPTFDIKETGTTIFSTLLSIDASAFTSATAGVPAVISDTAIANNAEITIDITVAGTGAKGPKVTIYGHK
jgi:hypothetical protein